MNTVYYAIHKSELSKRILNYEYNPEYTGKGVNLSLRGLKKFIFNAFPEDNLNDWFYITLPLSDFRVVSGSIKDPVYHMITVETPFTIELAHYSPKRLF